MQTETSFLVKRNYTTGTGNPEQEQDICWRLELLHLTIFLQQHSYNFLHITHEWARVCVVYAVVFFAQFLPVCWEIYSFSVKIPCGSYSLWICMRVQATRDGIPLMSNQINKNSQNYKRRLTSIEGQVYERQASLALHFLDGGGPAISLFFFFLPYSVF